MVPVPAALQLCPAVPAPAGSVEAAPGRAWQQNRLGAAGPALGTRLGPAPAPCAAAAAVPSAEHRAHSNSVSQQRRRWIHPSSGGGGSIPAAEETVPSQQRRRWIHPSNWHLPAMGCG